MRACRFRQHPAGGQQQIAARIAPGAAEPGGLGEALITILRGPALLATMVIGLSAFYRYGPSRQRARWRWISVGSVVAALVWIAASILFSWYVASFDSYNRMYGSLGAVIAFMIWLWLSSIVVLLGAEIDAQVEAQGALEAVGDVPKLKYKLKSESRL